MTEVYLIGGMALVTFLIRYSLFALSGRIELPKRIFAGLRYVPPAVLTAIVVPAVLMPGGHIEFSYTNVYLIGGIVAFLVGWFSRSLLLTIVIGMMSFFAWQWLLLFFT